MILFYSSIIFTIDFIDLNFYKFILISLSHIGHFSINYYSFATYLQHSEQILSPQHDAKQKGKLVFRLNGISHLEQFINL